MNFRTVYVLAIVLTLLFGVGLGYQTHILVSESRDDNDSSNSQDNSDGLYPSAKSPKPVTEIYLRTGVITNFNDRQIDFSSYIQNTDASYSKVTLTASVDEETLFNKIMIDGSDVTTENISLSDFKIGDDIAVESETNIYGKTLFNASKVQLHAY